MENKCTGYYRDNDRSETISYDEFGEIIKYGDDFTIENEENEAGNNTKRIYADYKLAAAFVYTDGYLRNARVYNAHGEAYDVNYFYEYGTSGELYIKSITGIYERILITDVHFEYDNNYKLIRIIIDTSDEDGDYWTFMISYLNNGRIDTVTNFDKTTGESENGKYIYDEYGRLIDIEYD